MENPRVDSPAQSGGRAPPGTRRRGGRRLCPRLLRRLLRGGELIVEEVESHRLVLAELDRPFRHVSSRVSRTVAAPLGLARRGHRIKAAYAGECTRSTAPEARAGP